MTVACCGDPGDLVDRHNRLVPVGASDCGGPVVDPDSPAEGLAICGRDLGDRLGVWSGGPDERHGHGDR